MKRSPAATSRAIFGRISQERFIIPALILLASALRLATLGDQSYWYDEVASVEIAEARLRDLPGLIRHGESTPPLYYSLAWFWGRLGGTNEFAFRLLSALPGIAIVPVAYLSGRAVGLPRAGVGAAALAAVSPVLVWYSQEARAYSLYVLATAVSFLFFLRSTQHASRLNVALWAVSSSVALTAHYFSAFVVVAEAAWLIATVGPRRRVLVATAALAATAAPLVILGILQDESRSKWITNLPIEERAGQGLERMLLPSVAPWWAGVTEAPISAERGLVALGVILFAAALLALAGSQHERRAGGLCFAVATAGLVLPLLGVLSENLDRLLDRNLLGAWLPLNLGVAVAFSAQRARWLGTAALVVLVAASLAITVTVAGRSELQRDDWRRLAAQLGPRKEIVVIFPSYQDRPLKYYASTLSPLPVKGAITDGVTVITSTERLPESFQVPTGFALTNAASVQHFSLFSFRAGAPRTVSRVDLSTPGGDGAFTFLVHRPDSVSTVGSR